MQIFQMDTPKRRPRSSKRRDPIRPTRPVACRKLFSFNDQDVGKVSSTIETWSVEENKALVQFVLFHGLEDTWPSHSKSSKFWSEATLFIQRAGGASIKRTGNTYKLETIMLLNIHNKKYTYSWSLSPSRHIQISKAICHTQIG